VVIFANYLTMLFLMSILFYSIFWFLEYTFRIWKQFFFPDPVLPQEVVNSIERDAHEIIWSIHRAGDGPDFAEYLKVVKYLHDKKYDEYFINNKKSNS